MRTKNYTYSLHITLYAKTEELAKKKLARLCRNQYMILTKVKLEDCQEFKKGNY